MNVDINQDKKYMSLALVEARKGLGRTSPNPCVGAVIVKDGKILGKGYHKKAGTPHAEVNALNASGCNVHGATIYVTLEPCNHNGRTPPCTRAVLSAGISRVVVGMEDPNPHVDGGGCKYLKSKGLSVTSGVLEKECHVMNYPFIKHSSTGMPWVILKAGMSLDGRISYVNGSGGRITGFESSLRVHQMRDHLDSIMIGVETALIDNPSLTCRLPGSQGKDPLRIILDTHLRLPLDSRTITQTSSARTLIFCGPNVDRDKKKILEEDTGATVKCVDIAPDGRLNLKAVFRKIGSLDVTSVLVEGGATIHGALLRHKLVDQMSLFVAPFFVGNKGTPLLRGYAVHSPEEAVRLHSQVVSRLGEDILIEGLVG